MNQTEDFEKVWSSFDEWRRQFCNTAQFIPCAGGYRDVIINATVTMEQLADRYVKEHHCPELRDRLIAEMKVRDSSPVFPVVLAQVTHFARFFSFFGALSERLCRRL
jgi:hypothetical protein